VQETCTSFLHNKLASKQKWPTSKTRALSHVVASILHQTEYVLFRARNLHEKNLAASRNDRHASFLHVCHGHNVLSMSLLFCVFVITYTYTDPGAVINTVFQKNTHLFLFYCSFYKCWPISITFGAQYTEVIRNTSVIDMSTSPAYCCYTTL